MNGMDCPRCGQPTDWGSTTNEWEYICTPCDARFNRDGERMPPFEQIRQLFPYTTVVRVPEDVLPFGYVPVLPPKDAA